MLSIAPGWELDVQRGPDWLLVRLSGGRTDSSETPPLADRLWELMRQHFVYRLVLELDELETLDSRLVGELAELRERIRGQDGLLRLCGLKPQHRRVLKRCRLGNQVLAYHDREEAIMGHCRPRQPK